MLYVTFMCVVGFMAMFFISQAAGERSAVPGEHSMDKFSSALKKQYLSSSRAEAQKLIKDLLSSWFKENEDGLLEAKSPKFVINLLGKQKISPVLRSFGMFNKHFTAVTLIAEKDAERYLEDFLSGTTYAENYNNVFFDGPFKRHYNTFFMQELNKRVEKEAIYDADKNKPDSRMLNDDLMSVHYKKAYFNEKAKNDTTKTLLSNNRDELKALIEASDPEFSRVEAEDFKSFFKERHFN